MLDFSKEQMVAFDMLATERKGRYLDEISIASFSSGTGTLNCKTKMMPISIKELIECKSINDVKDKINDDLIYADNLLFFDILSNINSLRFAAHVYDKFSVVLTEKQLGEHYSYIDVDCDEKKDDYRITVAEKIKQQIKSHPTEECVFFLKKNGFLVFNADYQELIKNLDEIEKVLKDNYLEDLYQKDSEYLLIKEELDGTNLTLKDRQTLAYQMLCYFDDICKKNNIKYSLAGGTLIGAIRHNGIISWDDDIDVFMARPEYNKLNEAFKNEHGRFEFINNSIDPSFPYPFSRIIDKNTLIEKSTNTFSAGLGIALDICVVDGLPNNSLMRWLHIVYMRLIYRLRRSTLVGRRNKLRNKHKFKYFLKILINQFADTLYWNKKLLTSMDKYDFNKSEYVANLVSQYGKKEVMHRSSFDEYESVIFNGKEFPVCVGYKEYLGNVYNSYLKLPAKAKRKPGHLDVTIWKIKERAKE